jgi:hypothetical protein
VIRVGVAVAPCFVDEEEHSASELLVIRHNDSTFASRDVFSLLQAEAADGAECSDIFVVVTGQKCLSAIFDDRQIVRVGKLHDRPHLTRIAEQVCDNDGPGLFADPCLNRFRGDVVSFWINVGKNGNRSLVDDRCQRAHVGDRRGDNLVAGLRIDRGNGRMHGCRSAGAGMSMSSAQLRSEALLKLADEGSLRAGQCPAAKYGCQIFEFLSTEGAAGRVLIGWKLDLML